MHTLHIDIMLGHVMKNNHKWRPPLLATDGARQILPHLQVFFITRIALPLPVHNTSGVEKNYNIGRECVPRDNPQSNPRISTMNGKKPPERDTSQ